MAATFGFSSPLPANNLPCGITSVVTDWSSGGNYSETISDLSETKFTQSHSFLKDQHGREKAHAITAEASWRYHRMDGTNLPLLANWAGGFHNSSLNLINGDVVVFGNSTVGHNGVPKWRLVIGGNTSEDRYVEMMLKRTAVIASATSSIIDNDIIWSTFTSAGDGGLFTGAAYRSPAGIKTFSVQGVDTYESLGPIKDANFTATLQCDEDSEGRYIPRNTVLIEYSVDVMDLSPTSLAVLDTFNQYASVDCKFALMDNVVITCADILGAVADPMIDGDVDKGGTIRFHGSGEILLSAWAALFS